jgi:hypothetical protein
MQQRHVVAAVAVAILAPVLLLACSPSGTGTPATSPAASAAPASPSASGSPAASPSSAPASASASASAAPSAAAGNDLASTIPPEINGIPITMSTVEPEAFIGANDRHRIQPLLTALGRTPADLEAVAGGGGADTNSVIIEAVRINGVDPSGLAEQIRTALADDAGSPVEAGTVAGKEVLTLGEDRHVYVTGDAIYFVSASNPEMAEATLTALP